MATAYHLEALRRQRVIDRARKGNQELGGQPTVEVEESVREASLNTPSHQEDSHRSASMQSNGSLAGSNVNTPKSGDKTPSRQSSRSVSAQSSQPISNQSSRPISAQTTSSKSSIKSNNSNHSGRGSKQGSRPTSAPLSTSHIDNASLYSFPDREKSSKIDGGSRSVSVISSNLSHKEVSNGLNTSLNGQIEIDVSRIEQGSVHSMSKGTTPRESRSNSSSKRSNSKLGSSVTEGSQKSWSSPADMKADQVRQDLHKQETFLHDSNLVMGQIDVDEELKLRKIEQ